MDEKGFIAFDAETPLFGDFAFFNLYTTVAPSLSGMKSFFVNSLGTVIDNETRTTWINANAHHLPMSTVLAEVTPGEIVTVADPIPVITSFKLGEVAGSWSLNFYPGALDTITIGQRSGIKI